MRLRYLAQPVRARDGRPAWIREVRLDDAAAVARFVEDLSPESRYFRFMMSMRRLSEDALQRFTQPVAGRESVLVVTPGTNLAQIVGIAQFVVDRDDGESAEFAVVVGDAWQRQGLGSRLLAELAAHAARHGITRVHADMLADNHAMRRLAERAGYAFHTHASAPFVVCLTGRTPPLETTTPSLPSQEPAASTASLH